MKYPEEYERRRLYNDFWTEHEKIKCSRCERSIHPTQSFFTDSEDNPICVACGWHSEGNKECLNRMRWNPNDEAYKSFFPKKNGGR